MKLVLTQQTSKRLTVGSDGIVYATMTKKDRYGSTTVTRRVKDQGMAKSIKDAHGSQKEEENLMKFITKKNLIKKFVNEKGKGKTGCPAIEYIDLTK